MDKKILQIGEYYITKKPMLLGTLLGSCGSICLYNKFNGYAAINHFLLPSGSWKKMKNDPGKYGKSSCEIIIAALMELDSDASHYTGQIFGGANMYNLGDSIGDIGKRNIKIAELSLRKYKIPIINRKTGGTKGMKIYFNTFKNRVDCRVLSEIKDVEKLKEQNRRAFKTIEQIYLKQCKQIYLKQCK